MPSWRSQSFWVYSSTPTNSRISLCWPGFSPGAVSHCVVLWVCVRRPCQYAADPGGLPHPLSGAGPPQTAHLRPRHHPHEESRQSQGNPPCQVRDPPRCVSHWLVSHGLRPAVHWRVLSFVKSVAFDFSCGATLHLPSALFLLCKQKC